MPRPRRGTLRRRSTKQGTSFGVSFSYRARRVQRIDPQGARCRRARAADARKRGLLTHDVPALRAAAPKSDRPRRSFLEPEQMAVVLRAGGARFHADIRPRHLQRRGDGGRDPRGELRTSPGAVPRTGSLAGADIDERARDEAGFRNESGTNRPKTRRRRSEDGPSGSKKPRLSGAFLKAAEGTRTLDLLHGKCLNSSRMVTAGLPFSCYRPLFARSPLHSR
jgi:hypothetical protein